MIATNEAPQMDVSEVISSCLWKYYGAMLPPRLAGRLVDSRLIEVQVSFWVHLLAGEDTVVIRDDMNQRASFLNISTEVLEQADARIIWDITPEIAASLACAPGSETISLRKIAQALNSILAAALSSSQMRIIHQAPHTQAA